MATLALRAEPSEGRGPKNLAEFIARMQAREGGFRAIDEDELRQEVEARQNGPAEPEDVDMADADVEEEKDADEDPDAKDLAEAQTNLLMSAESAHQHAMITLDFISLLLSKVNPSSAAETLSKQLRGMVGVGTLSATVLPRPTKIAQDRVGQFQELQMGRRLLSQKSSANVFTTNMERLRKEIRLEERYWHEVTEVGKSGWSIYRMQQEPHPMGVRFGFSTASWAESKPNSVATLRRGKDGSVRLECGPLAGTPKRIYVTILKNGEIVGRSSLPQLVPDDAPLEERVKEARNSIFAQELWYELNREGRNILRHGVSLEKDAITLELGDQRTMHLRLVNLADEQIDGSDMLPESDYAESINKVLHLMLSHAHRLSERNAAQFQQAANNAARGASLPTYSLLSPIIIHNSHEQVIRFCAKFLGDLVAMLRAAGITSASCKMTEPSITITPADPPAEGAGPGPAGPTASSAAATALSPTELLVNSLLLPTQAQFDLIITPDARLRIVADPSPTLGTRFLIGLLPSLGSGANAQETRKNPLLEMFRPLVAGEPSYAWAIIGFADVHYTLQNLVWYVQSAVPRALTARYLEFVVRRENKTPESSDEEGESDEDQEGDDEGRVDRWLLDSTGKGITNEDNGRYGVAFEVEASESTTVLGREVPLRSVLRVTMDAKSEAKGREREQCSWTAQGGQGLAATNSVDKLVGTLLSGGVNSR